MDFCSFDSYMNRYLCKKTLALGRIWPFQTSYSTKIKLHELIFMNRPNKTESAILKSISEGSIFPNYQPKLLRQIGVINR